MRLLARKCQEHAWVCVGGCGCLHTHSFPSLLNAYLLLPTLTPCGLSIARPSDEETQPLDVLSNDILKDCLKRCGQVSEALRLLFSPSTTKANRMLP